MEINYAGVQLLPNRYIHALKDKFYKNILKPFNKRNVADCDWERFAHYADDAGFDTRALIPKGQLPLGIVTSNNKDDYTLTRDILHVGDYLIRYGSNYGEFFAPAQTPYEALSMPYVPEELAFHVYKVIKVPASSRKLRRGIVAENFEQPGKGTQFCTRETTWCIADMLGVYLEEVTDSFSPKELKQYVR